MGGERTMPISLLMGHSRPKSARSGTRVPSGFDPQLASLRPTGRPTRGTGSTAAAFGQSLAGCSERGPDSTQTQTRCCCHTLRVGLDESWAGSTCGGHSRSSAGSSSCGNRTSRIDDNRAISACCGHSRGRGGSGRRGSRRRRSRTSSSSSNSSSNSRLRHLIAAPADLPWKIWA